MKTTRKPLSALLLLLLSACLAPGEEEKALSSKARLQKALFAEEAERDLAAAAREYEHLVEEYSEARQVGLSALYRLAEVRRKQERNEEAAALYQRVVAEFPESDEARLSRENLTALGIAIPGAPDRIPDDPDETKELRRLMLLAKNSPEQVWDEVRLDGNNNISPLSMAARRGWLRILAFLLNEHQKAGRSQEELDLALYSAAKEGQIGACKLLAKNGAQMTIAKSILAPSIAEKHEEVAEWLLAEGVNVDSVGIGAKIPLPEEVKRSRKNRGVDGGFASLRLAPLGAAIASGQDEWIDRLLKLGADLNQVENDRWEAELSPLSVACWKGNLALVKRLLELGADANLAVNSGRSLNWVRILPSEATGWQPLHYAADKPKIVALLLAAGADPNGKDADGLTPLHVAAYSNSAKSCAMLLQAGAKSDPMAEIERGFDGISKRGFPTVWPSLKKWTPTMMAAAQASPDDQGAAARKIITLLIDRGADPTPDFFTSHDLLDLCPVRKLRVWLAELVRYPGLAKKGDITLAFPVHGVSQVLVPNPEDETKPPSLAHALLEWTGVPSSPVTDLCRTDRGVVKRENEDGSFAEIPVVFTDVKSHPEIRWGDIIEFLPEEIEGSLKGPPEGSTGRRVYPVSRHPKQLLLEIYSQLKVKITIEWPDHPQQDLTLNGALRVYDPSRAEAPLVWPAALVRLLGGRPGPSLQLKRSAANGGDVISIPPDQQGFEEEGFGPVEFRDGDVLTVGKLDPQEAENFRKHHITLLEPASGFRWYEGVPESGDAPKIQAGGKIPGSSNPNRLPHERIPAVYPTLLQFLTAFYLPWETNQLRFNGKKPNQPGYFEQWKPEQIADAVRLSGAAPWATIRHPNLSEIWIDRLNGTRIRVSLSELAAKCDENTPNEFYRNADPELRPGDIVELRILPDHRDQPWTGFGPRLTRFIQNALTYSVNLEQPIEPGQGHHEVRWDPPHWYETSAGPIAVGKSFNSPFIMTVDEFGEAISHPAEFKWGLRAKWLRHDILIKNSLGTVVMAQRTRVRDQHPGRDGRGMRLDLRPLRLPSSTPTPRRNNSRRFVPRPPSR